MWAGTYRKDEYTLNWYDKFVAHDIELLYGYGYYYMFFIRAPRLWQGWTVHGIFPILSIPQYAFWLKMDDDSPTPAVVDSYTHYDQTFEGTDPNTEDHHVAGVHDGALHFNGSDNRIMLTAASYESFLDDYQPFTLAIWWKPDAPGSATYKDFLSSAAIAEAGIQFAINTTKSKITVANKLGGTLTQNSFEWDEDDLSIWQHWAFVRDGKTIRMYKNGIKGFENTSDFMEGRYYTIGRVLTIGCQRGVTAFAAGAADDVHLFNSALSDAEVLALATP
jgi:hypothetical protein